MLVYSQTTRGRFITEDVEMLIELKRNLATEHVRDFFQKMRQLGFSDEETLKIIQDTIKGEPS